MTQQTAATGSVSYTSLFKDSRYISILSVAMAATLTGNILSPALPGIADAFGVSSARIGLAVTAYSLPTAFFLPVSGVLADLYGRRTIVLPALVVFGLAGTAIAFVNSFEAIITLLVVQGVASAGISPLTVTLLGDIYNGAQGAAAQGGRVAANKTNNIMLPAIVGFLAGINWNYPFFLFALTFIVTAVAYVYLPSPTEDNHTTRGFQETVHEYVSALRVELKDRTLALLVSGGGVRDFVKYAVVPFVPLFAVQSLGASYAAAGATLSARGISGVVAAPLAGPLVTVFSRKRVLIGAFGISAVGTALIPAASTVLMLGAAVGVFGIGDAIFAATIKDTVTDATTDEYRAGVISSMSILKKLTKSAAPAFFGVILAVAGFGPLFYLAAVVAVGYAITLAVALPARD